MGEINTSRAEQEALDAIDIKAFGNIVDKAVREGRSTEVRQALYRCGPYGSGYATATLFEAISRVRYPDLDLSHLDE